VEIPGATRRGSLRITARFVLVLVVLVLSMGAVAGAGFNGLASAHRALDHQYTDNILHTKTVSDLGATVDDAHIVYLQFVSTKDQGARRRLSSQLDVDLIPAIDMGIAETVRLNADYRPGEVVAREMLIDWRDFRRAWLAQRTATPAVRSPADDRVASILSAVTDDSDELVRLEAAEATANQASAQRSYHSDLRLMVAILLAALLAGAVMVAWLIRTVLPRTLAYSRFAARIADGDFEGRLEPTGADEIAQLGRTLDDVAHRRQVAAEYERTQLEFADSLQLTDDERETQGLLKRHLERSIGQSSVTVFNRNNSADRLEAVTEVPTDSPLLVGLDGASPKSCLAVRAARTHVRAAGQDSLVSCAICDHCPGNTTCSPLLVSGEVIGAVLVDHREPLSGDHERRIGESVRQAAPVVANLRNLSIAQLRASTDALTGLPNRRALLDNMKRLVAQSRRTDRPLSALMLDLDHFKQVNDRFGHSRGDEVLAAVGITLRDMLRGDDFAGRYGGEEFLVLLPDTTQSDALAFAEKILTAIGEVRITRVQGDITLSIGVATMPDHALDGDALERAADRALYAAKNNGRNRVEVAASNTNELLSDANDVASFVGPSVNGGPVRG